MNEGMLRFLIVWGPTLLFALTVLTGFVVGLIRGFRKSLILFIHMLVAFIICIIIYLCMVKSKNLDQSLVRFINSILNKSGNSLQGLMKVDEGYQTLHEMLLAKIVMNMKEEDLMYHLIVDNAAYIYTLVDMIYRMILFILVSILYSLIIFLFYLIYVIAYPVRRKVKKHNRKYAAGEVSSPYRKKRLFGGLVGLGRSLIIGVISFSFLGSLIFIVSGGTEFPNRQELRDEEVSFEDEKFNQVYDYYSYVCELSNTGIFKVLNGIKDPSKTPFYFYVSDLVFQGKISDENLGIEDKFYLRDETGTYVAFVKDIFLLFARHSTNEEMNLLLSKDSSMEEKWNLMSVLMQSKGFTEEFNQIIDNFETKPFIKNLCISSLTSLVNHIDLAVKNNEIVVEMVQVLFKGENAIQVTDLATEQDVKNVFKALVNVIATSNVDEPEALSELEEEEPAQKAKDAKKMILYARKILPTIENLSLFQEPDRKEKGNLIISKLYEYCSTKFVDGTVALPEVDKDINWIDEFQILLKSADPILGMGYHIYDTDKDALLNNVFALFDGEQGSQNESYYDEMTELLSQSKLINVVFRSSFVGKSIDDVLMNITKNEGAAIPKDIDYGSGKDSEGYILLTSFKHFIKNNGKKLYEDLSNHQDITGETITNIFDLLSQEIVLEDQSKSTLVDEMLKSKLLHYVLSNVLYYGEFGSFKLYVPKDVLEEKIEGEGEEEKIYPIIQKDEIVKVCHILVDCKDVIAPLVDQQNTIDYASLFSNENFTAGIQDSILLKGTVANIFINSSKESEWIVLPASFDNPEQWLTAQEVEAMVDAVSALSEQKAENGELLINQMMTGSIQSSELMNLDDHTIDTLFSSVVLRYTMSSLIQNMNSDRFELVVPYQDYEQRGALTTSNKTVDVIKKEVLGSVLKDVKGIVKFDEVTNEPKMNAKAIFENKAKLVSNDVLHATVINYLILLTKNVEETSIVVPDHYQQAFEEWRNNPNVDNNIWFGSTVEEAEVYLLLDFIESCIVDEQGAIPDDFSFEEDFTSKLTLHNTDESLNEICSSALMNATISKQIVKSMPTPTALYHQQLIEDAEMKSLLKGAFLVLEKDEIAVSELANFNTDQVSLKESMVEPLLESEIFCSTLSKYLNDSEYVVVPKTSVYEETLVDETQHFILHHQPENNELKTVLLTLIDIFGMVPEGETEKCLIIQNIKTDDLVVTQEIRPKIAASNVLQATLSYYMVYKTDHKIVIPNDPSVVEQVEVISKDGLSYKIEENELDQMLEVAIYLFGDGTSLKISEMKTEHVKVYKDQVPLITRSMIMNTTIMDDLIGMEEMIIPRVDGKLSTADKLEVEGEHCLVIQKDEIEYLLTTLIDILGTDNSIDTSAIQTSRLYISKGIDVTKSEILSATLGNRILQTKEFMVPMDCMRLTAPIIRKTTTEDTKDLIQPEDLQQLLDSIFVLVDHITIDHSQSDISIDDLAIKKANVPAVLKSSIIETTISDKLFMDTLYIPNLPTVVEEKDCYQYEHHITIVKDEMQHFWDAIFIMLNEETLTLNQLKDSNRIKNISKSTESIQAILGSYIIKTTMSKAIYDAEALEKLPRSIAAMSVMNGSTTIQEMVMVTYAELETFIPALFDTTSGDKIDLNAFSIDSIVLPNTEEKATHLVQSDIITATMSKQVLAIDTSKIIILDKCLETDGNVNYIVKQELAKLLIGLSVGLSIDNLNVVSSFDKITVPQTGETTKIDALVGSDILRATISQKALSNQSVAIQKDAGAYVEEQYQNNRVAVLTSDEIHHLIAGLNLIGGDFENINLSLTVILSASNKKEILHAIAASNIYRAMLSKELVKEIPVTNMSTYLTLYSEHETEQIVVDEVTTSYSYQAYMGKYVIQNPTEQVEFYHDFNMSNLENQSLFTKQDIVALEYVSITNL